MSILGNLWSWTFAAGLASGFVLSRLWCLAKVIWLDRRRPLAGGRRRSRWNAVSIDSRWLAAAAGVVFMAWSVIATQDNADENKRTTEAMRACNIELIDAINGSRKITRDNDRLSEAERALFAENSNLGREWIRSVVLPPPDIARLDVSDPIRERYTFERTRDYFERIGELNQRLDAVQTAKAENTRMRPPLPDPSCPN